MGDAMTLLDPKTPIDDPMVKIPQPFVRALKAAGINTLGQAWAMGDKEILALHGTGPKGVRMLRELEAG
jgi:hypothetical protein